MQIKFLQVRLFISLLLLSAHTRPFAQIISITGTCNDSVLMSFKGAWKKQADVPVNSINYLPRAQFPEVAKRIDVIHNCMLEAYPQPTGLEAIWNRLLALDYPFAHNIYYEKGTKTNIFQYFSWFPYYSCIAGQPQKVALSGETPNACKIVANDLSLIRNILMLDTSIAIDGIPFYMRNPVKGSWKGYDLIYCGEDSRAVVISRKGESPYIPVTRKQYLDYSFKYLNKLFDQSIQAIMAVPVRSLAEQEKEKQAALDKMDADYKNDPKRRDANKEYYLSGYQTDQQRRDESANKLVEAKNKQLKRYQEAQENSRAAGLLDSAAIVRTPNNIMDDIPVFTTEAEEGSMLYFENPAYIRKDMPKYIPQFLVMFWKWGNGAAEYGGDAGRNFRKLLEANFPIEKLQAMIDK